MGMEEQGIETKEQVRRAIDLLGMTRQQFADEIGVTESTVSRWLDGSRIPDERSRRLIRYTIDRYAFRGKKKEG
jgi:DNA-binding transcriptional regulator YiaG